MAEPQFPNIETVPAAPERAAEAPEGGGGFEAPERSERPVETAVPAPSAPRASAPPAAPAKDPVTARVESVMEEGLKDAYKAMPPALQQRFKAHGEKVAAQISAMVKSLKVQAGKVLELIRGWLKMIPGVNRFFLIQEAKIKTDKILALAEDEKKRQGTI